MDDAASRKLFNESLKRCQAREGLFERFCELFVASSPEVRAKFAGTDLERQAEVLGKTFLKAKLAGSGSESVLGDLEKLARIHSRAELDIPPHLYDLWLDCLLAAVREFDEEASDDVDAAWRRVLSPAIEFMTDRY